MNRLIFIVCFFLFPFSFCSAQELWDDDSLKNQKVFTSISEALQNPDSVFRLDLSKQKLTEIPAQVFQLKNLRELKANKNKISVISEAISTLTLLQSLSLENNKLKAIPPQIGELKNLKYLILNRNLIETIPPEIGKLFNLEDLELWDNEISVIADDIRFCSSLKVLELRGILFSDEQQRHIHDILPYTKVYFSPSCNCKN
ncbi:MAG TPA: leucine-rich repeat domain-containing protein [Bacteroidia bacterium]|nr:leucine-rich repeat domain-containing protein [Bacteroidia bacterium]HNU32784.1 leucine-rich repeat domain-containing protein [Bacteroidia bacterium]